MLPTEITYLIYSLKKENKTKKEEKRGKRSKGKEERRGKYGQSDFFCKI